MRRSLSLAALFAAATLVVACGGNDGSTTADNNDEVAARPAEHGGMNHEEVSPVAPGARRIEVTGLSFGFGPSEITVSAEEDVAIALTSEDTLHDFSVEELGLHVVAAEEGHTEAGGLRIDEPDRYTFYCTVTGHRQGGMEGTLVVQ
jgi:heme/copper-type cytochrome/quinol oxidase subunit 2